MHQIDLKFNAFSEILRFVLVQSIPIDFHLSVKVFQLTSIIRVHYTVKHLSIENVHYDWEINNK